MTDATGAEVWRMAAQPFGETAAITGTAANDNRFPGQVFDAESIMGNANFSGNWIAVQKT